MIDPLHQEFLDHLHCCLTPDEEILLAQLPVLRLFFERWFVFGYDAGIRYSIRRYHPEYVEVFGDLDYGEALPVLRQPIEC